MGLRGGGGGGGGGGGCVFAVLPLNFPLCSEMGGEIKSVYNIQS